MKSYVHPHVTQKNVLLLIVGVGLFLIFQWLITIFALSSVEGVQITAQPAQTGSFKIYSSGRSRSGSYSEKRSIESEVIEAGIQKTVTLPFRNRIAGKLRIDPMAGAGSVYIQAVVFSSNFGDERVYLPPQIAERFRPSGNTTIDVVGESAIVTSTDSDPQLEHVGPIRFSNPVFSLVLPLFLAILSVLILRTVRFSAIHAIADIRNKKPSTSHNIMALDGLRGLAALLVIADHTDIPYFKGLGATGVWLFFCLSGFLLSIPFVKSPSLITSSEYLRHYFIRRIQRILPMYYFILTITYLFRGKIEDYLRHLFFLQGDGIFWSVPQEMFFYMILPFVFLLSHFLCRGNYLWMILGTFILTFSFNHYLETDFLYIYGNGRKLSLWLGIFLSGVGVCYFYHSPYCDALRKQPSALTNAVGLGLLATIVLCSDGVLGWVTAETKHYTWIFSGFFGYIAALMILFTIIDEKSIIGRIMSFYPLRAVGIVGFSFYLLHPTVLSLVKNISMQFTDRPLSGLPLLLAGILATYLFAAATYSLIERPFLGR